MSYIKNLDNHVNHFDELSQLHDYRRYSNISHTFIKY